MLSLLYCLSGHRESESSPCSPSFIVCQDTGRVSPHHALPPLLFVRTQEEPRNEGVYLVHVLVLQARPNQPQHVSHTEKGLVMLCKFSCATLKFSCDQLILIQFWIVSSLHSATSLPSSFCTSATFRAKENVIVHFVGR